MSLFVDTSVWSLAFRRDHDSSAPEVRVLRDALEGGGIVLTTGLILQELLQGFSGPQARKDIIERFTALPLLPPDRQDPNRRGRRRCGAGSGRRSRSGLTADVVSDIVRPWCFID